MDVLNLARKFLDAIERGDTAAARACYADDAIIWHNFDNKEKTVDENMASLEKWKRYVDHRKYDLQRLERLPNGYLQQHILTGVTKEGIQILVNACLICTVFGDKIIKLEEYLDPAPASIVRNMD
jgi:ketosteroid isomerase-like protein